MYLMIDNYDSYVYNLAAYMQELKMQLEVIRSDRINLKKIWKQMEQGKIEGMIISPGPKHPKDFDDTKIIIKTVRNKVPILGVCLGHQMIADAFGAKVIRGKQPMHGKISKVKHNGTHILKRIPSPFQVTRYHSLVVSEENFPKELCVDARSEDGTIMAISHRHEPIYGVQFHPEAVLTEYGYELIENYKEICERWKA